MKWYEVVEDGGDGENIIRRFRTLEEACKYVEENEEWCYQGYELVDTESEYFFE